jgi:hypothetical protein
MLDLDAITALVREAVREVAAEIASAARGGGAAPLAGPVPEVIAP